jgi:hypothetical protein
LIATLALFAVAALVLLQSPQPAFAQAQPAADIVQRISALKAKPGSDAWDEEVEKILLAAFDTDKSGEIDKEDELAAIPCEVWDTLDKAIRAGAGKDASLIANYSITLAGNWDGDALGIDEKLRKPAVARLQVCGIQAK